MIEFEQRKSKWQPLILDAIVRGAITMLAIQNVVKAKESTFYYSVNRLRDLGLITITGERGKRKFMEKGEFQDFTYTLRLIGTNKANSIHSWDFTEDIETTLKGTVPIGTTEEEISDIYFDNLFGKTMESLFSEGILLGVPFERVKIKDFAKRGISGIELGTATKKFDNKPKIEIVFTNNIGRVYIFDNSIQTTLEDFT